MRPWLAQVVQNVCILAARLFQGVGKHSQACGVKRAVRQDTVVVGGVGKRQDGRGLPGGVEGERTEGVADHITKQGSLSLSFCTLRSLTPFKVGVAVFSKKER